MQEYIRLISSVEANKSLTPAADDDATHGTMVIEKVKVTKPALQEVARKAALSSTCNKTCGTDSLMCILISLFMLILSEATLFFVNVITNGSLDKKAALSKHVTTWISSSAASPPSRTSTVPPPSSSSLALKPSRVESYSSPDVPIHLPAEDHMDESPEVPVAIDAKTLGFVLVSILLTT